MFPYLRSVKYFRQDFSSIIGGNNASINDLLRTDCIEELSDSIESLISYRFEGGISDNEKKSWINNMIYMNKYALKNVDDNSNVKIAFEYVNDFRVMNDENNYVGENGLIGYTNRVDVMLGGKGKNGKDVILAFELKSWSAENIMIIEYDGVVKLKDENINEYIINDIDAYNNSSKDNLRIVYKSGNNNYIICDNPAKQIKRYMNSIYDENTKINTKEKEGQIELKPFVWLYNYNYDVNQIIDKLINKWKDESEGIEFYTSEDNDNISESLEELLDFNRTDENDVFSEYKKGFSDFILHDNISNIFKYKHIFCSEDYREGGLSNGKVNMLRLRGDQYNCLNKIINEIDRFDFKNNSKVIKVTGGVGSGKSLLAVLLYKYCMEQKDFVPGEECSFVCPQGAEIYAFEKNIKNEYGIYVPISGNLKEEENDGFIKTRIPGENKFRFVRKDNPNYIVMNNDYKIFDSNGNYETIKGEKLSACYYKFSPFSIFRDSFGSENKCKITIIDEGHNLIESDEQFEKICEKSNLVIVFYDNRQTAGSDFKLFEEVPDYRLSSHFRCNKDEGYLDFINDLLNNISKNPLDYYGVDFDVKLIENINNDYGDRYRLLCVENEKNDSFSNRFSDIKISSRDVGGKLVLKHHKFDSNDPFVFIKDEELLKYGTYLDIRGLEIKNDIVILKKEVIKYDKRCKRVIITRGEDKERDVLKKRLEILLTRALQSCYIYCEDNNLFEYLSEVRKIPVIKKE